MKSFLIFTFLFSAFSDLAKEDSPRLYETSIGDMNIDMMATALEKFADYFSQKFWTEVYVHL